MRQVTATEKYRAVNEGKLAQGEFVRQMRMSYPSVISQWNSYDDTVQILKNKGYISEKTEVEAYDYRYDRNISPESVLRGIRYELQAKGLDPSHELAHRNEELLGEIEAVVVKNLKKHPLHYINLLAGDTENADKHDREVEIKRGEGKKDEANGLKKAELNESASNKLKQSLLKEGYTEEQINSAIQRLKEKKVSAVENTVDEAMSRTIQENRKDLKDLKIDSGVIVDGDLHVKESEMGFKKYRGRKATGEYSRTTLEKLAPKITDNDIFIPLAIAEQKIIEYLREQSINPDNKEEDTKEFDQNLEGLKGFIKNFLNKEEIRAAILGGADPILEWENETEFRKPHLDADLNEEPSEGNKFSGALAKAKKAGEDEFTVDGEKYNVKESKNQQLKESVKKIIVNILKEESSLNEEKGLTLKDYANHENFNNEERDAIADLILIATDIQKAFLKSETKIQEAIDKISGDSTGIFNTFKSEIQDTATHVLDKIKLDQVRVMSKAERDEVERRIAAGELDEEPKRTVFSETNKK